MKIRNVALSNLVVMVLLLWGFYFLFGVRLVSQIYEGKAAAFLNDLINGQATHGIDFYLDFLRNACIEFTVFAFIFAVFLFLSSNLRLAFLSLLVSLCLLEYGLRAYEDFWASRYPGNTESEHLWVYDPMLGWKNRPDSEGVMASPRGRYQTLSKFNSKGFRDEEYHYEKPKGVKRVLLLGDSLIAGTEVTRDKLIDVRLEALLNGKGRAEVINAGTRGYGTDQSYLVLISEGYRYQPDHIIYVFCENDWRNNITVHRSGAKFGKSYFVLEDQNQQVLKGIPVPEHFNPQKTWQMSTPQITKVYNQAFPADPESPLLPLTHAIFSRFRIYRWCENLWKEKKQTDFENHPPPFIRAYSEDITKALIRNMRDFTASRNIPFLIYEVGRVGVPTKTPSLLEQMCRELDIPYRLARISQPPFNKNPAAFHIRKDIHWNNAGHQLAAEDLYDYLLAVNQKMKTI